MIGKREKRAQYISLALGIKKNSKIFQKINKKENISLKTAKVSKNVDFLKLKSK
jgi:hypothetical protein